MERNEASNQVYELFGLVLRRLVQDRDISLAAALTLSSLDHHGPMRVTSLAMSEGIAQPSMTQLVQRLEARGLVRRSSDPDDARATVVSLTHQGERALADRRRVSLGRLQTLFADLTPEQAAALGAAVADVLPSLRATAMR